MNKILYPATHAVVFLYEIESKTSLKEVAERYEQFFSTIGKQNVVCVIAGNKSDLEE